MAEKMNTSDDFDLDAALAVLKKLAEGHEKQSLEYRTLERAAHALLFTSGSETGDRFNAYLRDADKELSAEQRANLRRMSQGKK
jgi:hypothetical protein